MQSFIYLLAQRDLVKTWFHQNVPRIGYPVIIAKNIPYNYPDCCICSGMCQCGDWLVVYVSCYVRSLSPQELNGSRLCCAIRFRWYAHIAEKSHGDVMTWKRFPPYRPFAMWIHQSIVMRSFDVFIVVSLTKVWRNSWVNVDFRRHDAHMKSL